MRHALRGQRQVARKRAWLTPESRQAEKSPEPALLMPLSMSLIAPRGLSLGHEYSFGIYLFFFFHFYFIFCACGAPAWQNVSLHFENLSKAQYCGLDCCWACGDPRLFNRTKGASETHSSVGLGGRDTWGRGMTWRRQPSILNAPRCRLVPLVGAARLPGFQGRRGVIIRTM